MAGLLEHSSWRLKTPKEKIKYRLVNISLDYETVKAGGTVEVIIRTRDYRKFLEEMLPEPKQYDQIYIPQYAYFIMDAAVRRGDNPGVLAVHKVTAKSLDDGLPIDPFLVDTTAPAGTYYEYLTCVLTLAVPPDGNQDPLKPETYLEISAESAGSFIHTPPVNMTTVDIGANGIQTAGAPKVKIKQQTIPHTVFCPQTMWDVKWKSVPYDNYKDVLVPRLENALAHVNKLNFNPLNIKYRETLLLLSYSYERSYTWRGRFTDKPMVDVTMKFMEKKVKWKDKIHGHNSQWIPGEGWKRVLMDDEPTFETYDFNKIFLQSSEEEDESSGP
jgi:hypothetical protein